MLEVFIAIAKLEKSTYISGDSPPGKEISLWLTKGYIRTFRG